jgi:hypothetical protein
VIGCGYVLIAVLMGHGDAPGDAGHGGADAHGHAGDGGHAGGDAHGDASGHDHSGAMKYGVEGSGHGSATSLGQAGPSAFHFPFFSPLALATLCGSIGAYGLIALHGLGVSETASLAVAIPAAVATAYAITYVGFRLMSGSRGSSQIRLQDFEGAPAEVITPIPAGGVGEIAAMVNGQRYAGPAREADGREVPRGAHVKVRAMVGTTFVVYK